jgi:hypothetical protein
MKKQNEPSEASHSPQGKGISDLIRYYKIGTAAALLGCTTEALLHLGAIGKVEITAPIVAAAEFTWPVGNATIGFIEIDTPFVHYFDASSRVSLFPYDLAKIEAVGWTVPWRFYAPTYSRQVIKSAPRTFEESITERNKQFRMAMLYQILRASHPFRCLGRMTRTFLTKASNSCTKQASIPRGFRRKTHQPMRPRRH